MLHRRDALLRLGQVALGGMSLPWLLRTQEAQATRGTPPLRPKAKNCILIYLWGGPPQLDTWDMKPQAPAEIRSIFKPISTAVPGIHICEHLPRMAKHTDKMAIIRSFTHSNNAHAVSVYYTLTGSYDPRKTFPRNQRSRSDVPNVASVISYFSPPSVMPSAVTVPNPIGHDGVVYAGTYAGFLGAAYDPLEFKPPAETKELAPHRLELVPGVDVGRLQARVGLLRMLEQLDHQLHRRSYPDSTMDRFRQQALAILSSPQARDAFKLEKEPEAIHQLYGKNQYGEAFLLARRLIERGVRLVTVVWYYVCPDGNVANVWDTHGGTPSLGRISGFKMLVQPYCFPSLDRAYSALLEDLHQRGLLEETLVVMLGEFGRTPKINKKAGRDHWGPAQSVVLAGGGIRGGVVYGATDRHAAWVVDRPVRPEDLIATIFYAFGLPPETLVRDPQGRTHRISHGRPLVELFA